MCCKTGILNLTPSDNLHKLINYAWSFIFWHHFSSVILSFLCSIFWRHFLFLLGSRHCSFVMYHLLHSGITTFYCKHTIVSDKREFPHCYWEQCCLFFKQYCLALTIAYCSHCINSGWILVENSLCFKILSRAELYSIFSKS